MRKKNWNIKLGYWGIVIFLIMNAIAIFHAYRFTHFVDASSIKTRNPNDLSLLEKTKAILLGINNPRPANTSVPNTTFETIRLQSNYMIECWKIEVPKAKGMVAIFHGFGSSKSAMMDKAAIFNQLGYSTFLVDFMGSGGSEGMQTSIGFHEAMQVKTVYEYLLQDNHTILLFGTSMGAAAIMKAIHDYSIQPQGILLECPFGTMYKTVAARFKAMSVPAFPMAGLLVFWGGSINGFWAFSHNPEAYAKKINIPTLLMSGAKDVNVSLEEINTIYENLKGNKVLTIFENAGHENYLIQYKDDWTNNVHSFLSTL